MSHGVTFQKKIIFKFRNVFRCSPLAALWETENKTKKKYISMYRVIHLSDWVLKVDGHEVMMKETSHSQHIW